MQLPQTISTGKKSQNSPISIKEMELLRNNLSIYNAGPVWHHVCFAAKVLGTGPPGDPGALGQLAFPTDCCALLGENHAQQNWKRVEM